MKGPKRMQVLTWLQPRDHSAAARTVALLCGVGVTVTVVTYPLLSADAGPVHPVLGVLAIAAFSLVVLVTASVRLLDEGTRLAWAICPLLAVVAIVLIDLATNDASIRAQIFFVFSTLYGCAMLTRPGALIMTGASILGEAVVVLGLLPFDEAVSNLAYMAAALGTTSLLLVRSAERQAALVAVLEQRAATDSLTGLVNRRVFDEVLVATLVEHPTDDPTFEGTALILIDVDRFKSINDEHGHPGGDQILVQLSEVLVAASRRGDVVCRLGGDEIAVLMPNCSIDVAKRRGEQLVATVRDHGFSLGVDTTVAVSLSAGIAHAPTHAHDSRGLYAAADAALYEAKRAGRDRVVSHQPTGW